MNMLSSFFPYYMIFENMIQTEKEIVERQEKRIAEIIQQWKDSKNFPRKKKKKLRKKLLKDYSFQLSLRNNRFNLFNFDL